MCGIPIPHESNTIEQRTTNKWFKNKHFNFYLLLGPDFDFSPTVIHSSSSEVFFGLTGGGTRRVLGPGSDGVADVNGVADDAGVAGVAGVVGVAGVAGVADAVLGLPQQFDAATYLPLMMSISPDDSPKDTSSIYASIVFLMENATSVMMQFAPQIVATIARTFGKRAQALKALKLPDDLRAKLIQLLKHLLSQLPNASDALREALGDDAALARLTALISD